MKIQELRLLTVILANGMMFHTVSEFEIRSRSEHEKLTRKYGLWKPWRLKTMTQKLRRLLSQGDSTASKRHTYAMHRIMLLPVPSLLREKTPASLLTARSHLIPRPLGPGPLF
ncbi:hypothetical protein AKJ16_DCAP07676 [Drosera capensis]